MRGLGSWLGKQRGMHWGTVEGLIPERDAKLQTLADCGKLYWDVINDTWKANYKALLAYGETHGHYNVPQS